MIRPVLYAHYATPISFLPSPPIRLRGNSHNPYDHTYDHRRSCHASSTNPTNPTIYTIHLRSVLSTCHPRHAQFLPQRTQCERAGMEQDERSVCRGLGGGVRIRALGRHISLISTLFLEGKQRQLLTRHRAVQLARISRPAIPTPQPL